MIIYDFVDELGVVDESKDYAPPNVPLTGDTQFGPSATIVVTNIKHNKPSWMTFGTRIKGYDESILEGRALKGI